MCSLKFFLLLCLFFYSYGFNNAEIRVNSVKESSQSAQFVKKISDIRNKLASFSATKEDNFFYPKILQEIQLIECPDLLEDLPESKKIDKNTKIRWPLINQLFLSLPHWLRKDTVFMYCEMKQIKENDCIEINFKEYNQQPGQKEKSTLLELLFLDKSEALTERLCYTLNSRINTDFDILYDIILARPKFELNKIIQIYYKFFEKILIENKELQEFIAQYYQESKISKLQMHLEYKKDFEKNEENIKIWNILIKRVEYVYKNKLFKEYKQITEQILSLCDNNEENTENLIESFETHLIKYEFMSKNVVEFSEQFLKTKCSKDIFSNKKQKKSEFKITIPDYMKRMLKITGFAGKGKYLEIIDNRIVDYIKNEKHSELLSLVVIHHGSDLITLIKSLKDEVGENKIKNYKLKLADLNFKFEDLRTDLNKEKMKEIDKKLQIKFEINQLETEKFKFDNLNKNENIEELIQIKYDYLKIKQEMQENKNNKLKINNEFSELKLDILNSTKKGNKLISELNNDELLKELIKIYTGNNEKDEVEFKIIKRKLEDFEKNMKTNDLELQRNLNKIKLEESKLKIEIEKLEKLAGNEAKRKIKLESLKKVNIKESFDRIEAEKKKIERESEKEKKIKEETKEKVKQLNLNKEELLNEKIKSELKIEIIKEFITLNDGLINEININLIEQKNQKIEIMKQIQQKIKEYTKLTSKENELKNTIYENLNEIYELEEKIRILKIDDDKFSLHSFFNFIWSKECNFKLIKEIEVEFERERNLGVLEDELNFNLVKFKKNMNLYNSEWQEFCKKVETFEENFEKKYPKNLILNKEYLENEWKSVKNQNSMKKRINELNKYCTFLKINEIINNLTLKIVQKNYEFIDDINKSIAEIIFNMLNKSEKTDFDTLYEIILARPKDELNKIMDNYYKFFDKKLTMDSELQKFIGTNYPKWNVSKLKIHLEYKKYLESKEYLKNEENREYLESKKFKYLEGKEYKKYLKSKDYLESKEYKQYSEILKKIQENIKIWEILINRVDNELLEEKKYKKITKFLSLCKKMKAKSDKVFSTFFQKFGQYFSETDFNYEHNAYFYKKFIKKCRNIFNEKRQNTSNNRIKLPQYIERMLIITEITGEEMYKKYITTRLKNFIKNEKYEEILILLVVYHKNDSLEIIEKLKDELKILEKKLMHTKEN